MASHSREAGNSVAFESGDTEPVPPDLCSAGLLAVEALRAAIEAGTGDEIAEVTQQALAAGLRSDEMRVVRIMSQPLR
jgi:hypothetical protein